MTLLISLLTILMSGVVASAVTFKLNARLQRRDLIRTKAEDLFSAFHEYCNSLRGHFVLYIPAFSGRTRPEDVRKAAREHITETDTSYFRNVQMLIGIYFPSLQGDLDKLKSIRDRLNLLVSQYHEDPANAGSLTHQFRRELSLFEEQEQMFKSALLAITRGL